MIHFPFDGRENATGPRGTIIYTTKAVNYWRRGVMFVCTGGNARLISRSSRVIIVFAWDVCVYIHAFPVIRGKSRNWREEAHGAVIQRSRILTRLC